MDFQGKKDSRVILQLTYSSISTHLKIHLHIATKSCKLNRRDEIELLTWNGDEWWKRRFLD